MSSSPIGGNGSEDGEASDSPNERQPIVSVEKEERRKDKKKKHHKHKHDKERKESDGDEEERLRRRLIEKKEKGEKKEDSGDDESEMFTIQPGGDQKRKEREKARERKDERDERDRPRGGDRRDVKSFHDHRDDRRREMERREGREGRDWKEDRRRDHRPPPGYRGHPRGMGGDRDRSHRRSRSRSVDRKRREEKRGRDRSRDGKRERKESERKKDDKEKEKDKEKSKVTTEIEKMEMKEEEKEEVEKMEIDEIKEEEDKEMKMEDESKEGSITPTPLNENKSKKYSKFDSSPESNEVPDSPYQSEVDYDSDVPGSQHSEEDVEEEEIIDLSTIPFEQLTEEQKVQLSPDSRNAKEKEWQKRLISQLPVYYPGINGCRNIAEYECMNRIEEGTFGVVYRARNRRTDEVVALKRLKMDKEKDGFPITSLREVNMLLKAAGHENIVNVLEIVVGANTDKTFLVMEFVEHDMKSLMETMNRNNKSFKMGEVKTLMMQLLRGMDHLHNLWILHRDLKSSNLLLNHKAVLKIADFGLAREYGEPLKAYTSVVVTLWYRSPELLLGIEKYSTEVDMWSVGCLMAEFINLKPLFTGRSEIEQIKKIFYELGTPSEKVWKGYDSLKGLQHFTPPQHNFNQLRKSFPAKVLSENGFRLLNELLRYDPVERITAENALLSDWFKENPEPIAREMFPTFPAKSEQGKRPPTAPAPKPVNFLPEVSAEHSRLLKDLNVGLDQAATAAKGFTLKFGH
ncbi:cdk-11.1 [Pristionchus pacificus]|uniref:cyclin-dependent kinase n=1 Tax=Pristionchus pacificus TaxID=54126 RepID=A0A2A6D3I1_PRIPA|nr:cdk-11.1 [Pristionchus pacificus]|eukprot:PDM84890.1 protein kinase [Pristionchus pacificus]